MKYLPLIAGAGLLYFLSTRASSTAPALTNYVPDIQPTGQALIPLPEQGILNPTGAQYVSASQLNTFNAQNELFAWTKAYQTFRRTNTYPIEEVIRNLTNNSTRTEAGFMLPETRSQIDLLRQKIGELTIQWMTLNPKPVI